MFNKFLQAIVVGIANLGMIALVYYVFGNTAFYVVAFLGLLVYAFYLHTILEEYKRQKGISVKPKKEKKEEIVEVKPVVEVKPAVVPKKIVKPPVVKKEVLPTATDLVKLRDYIKYNIYYNQNEDKIKQKLREAGWLDQQIDEAFKEVIEGSIK